MRNVTPVVRPGTSQPGPRYAALAAIVVGLILFAVLLRGCGAHENANERLARDFTAAVAANDVARVDALETTDAQALTNHARVGRAADELSGLGKLTAVREQDAGDAGARGVHRFDIGFEHGVVREQLRIVDGKVAAFRYDVERGASIR